MTETIRPAGTHRRRAKLLLLFGGTLAAFLIAEAALRVSSFNYFNPYTVDEDVGYALRPGAEGWWKKESLTYVRINSHGFRDREHTIAKPVDTLRIAIVGDSFAEAFQVPAEKAFWSVIERNIPSCPAAKSKVEVLNFGISGFSTARELILLRKRVWQYSHDVIVLLVTTGNDIRDNSATLTKYETEALPYFVLRDGKLVLDDSRVMAYNRSLRFRLRKSFLGKCLVWMQSNVRLLGLAYTAREAINARAATPKPQEQARLAGEPGTNNDVYGPPNDPEWLEAWKVTEALITQMRNEVSAKGAQFLVVTGSMAIQVNPEAELRQKVMKGLGVNDLFYPDRQIKSLGEREGFTVLNLAPAQYEYATRNKVYLHGSGETIGRGHWNETGHQLAGELIAQELCKMIFAEK